jgi:hypothetical protein
MAEPLRDPEFFAPMFLEFGAPTWPFGFDIAPQWLGGRWQLPVSWRGRQPSRP